MERHGLMLRKEIRAGCYVAGAGKMALVVAGLRFAATTAQATAIRLSDFASPGHEAGMMDENVGQIHPLSV